MICCRSHLVSSAWLKLGELLRSFALAIVSMAPKLPMKIARGKVKTKSASAKDSKGKTTEARASPKDAMVLKATRPTNLIRQWKSEGMDKEQVRGELKKLKYSLPRISQLLNDFDSMSSTASSSGRAPGISIRTEQRRRKAAGKANPAHRPSTGVSERAERRRRKAAGKANPARRPSTGDSERAGLLWASSLGFLGIP